MTSNKLWPNKYIPREFYEVLLERLLEDPTQRILVFSDTPQEVDRLKEKSDRVMGISDLFGERDFTSGARDFLELYAMSLCKQIYGPPSSAYSQTAMTIGGCNLRAVQDALTQEEHDIAMERMSQRLEQKSDLFINMGDVGQSCISRSNTSCRATTPRAPSGSSARIWKTGWIKALPISCCANFR